DPAEVPLPETLEQVRTQRWIELRRYFSNSAHGIPTTEVEFEANVDALEKILVDSLDRAPAEDLSAIDRILEEGSKDAYKRTHRWRPRRDRKRLFPIPVFLRPSEFPRMARATCGPRIFSDPSGARA